MICSVLQCGGASLQSRVCCGVISWRRIAVNFERCIVCCSVLQCVAVYCSVLQCVAVCCSVLQCAAVCCSVLQCAAVCCNVLQGVCRIDYLLWSIAFAKDCRGVEQIRTVLRCVSVCCSICTKIPTSIHAALLSSAHSPIYITCV